MPVTIIPSVSSCPAGPLVKLGMVQPELSANYESNYKPFQFKLVVNNPENPRQSLKLFYDRDYQFVAAHTRTWKGLETDPRLKALAVLQLGCLSVYDDRSAADQLSVPENNAIVGLIIAVAEPVRTTSDSGR